MAIIVHLDRILLERRMTVTELAARIGLTVANISILKTGKARAVRFSTLEAICRALDCQPGDLLEHLGEEPRFSSAVPSPAADEAGAERDVAAARQGG